MLLVGSNRDFRSLFVYGYVAALVDGMRLSRVVMAPGGMPTQFRRSSRSRSLSSAVPSTPGSRARPTISSRRWLT